MKYTHVRNKITGKLGVRDSETKTIIYEGEAEYISLLKKYKSNLARTEKDNAMRSLGLTKVKGSLGGTYWE